MSTQYSPPPDDSYESAEPQPHPYLHEPLLHISGLPHHVTDENLAVAFSTCAPFRPRITRDDTTKPLSGIIEFKVLDKAERALATLHGRQIQGLSPPVVLVLSPYPPTTPHTPLPPPSASPRLVKHLPQGYTDSQLYNLFRPFGALASVRAQTSLGKATGVVEFWREEDARRAEEALHCTEIEGQNIAVQLYQHRRTSGVLSEFSPSAPPFVPSGSAYPTPYPTQYSPPRASPYHARSPLPFIHGPGQQVQLAPLHGPGSNSHSGLIDPCNLFCKNLDPTIDSNGLFTHFRKYGQIVSARVMRNENGDSRGFGFVSFQTPDQAAAAMHGMNGALLGSKQLVVRLHEPKQLRQEKLAARFAGHNGHPRSASGATSPTASEGGESYAGWPSPGARSAILGSPVGHSERLERPRRGSGSYYNAALAGTLNLPMRYDDLSALSPVVRKEVLTGELGRRLRFMPDIPSAEVDFIVDALIGLSLSDVVSAIQDTAKLDEQIQRARNALASSAVTPPTKTPSPANSQDSRLLDPNALNATASAPEHPSTPISVAASLSTPPRTSSPSGSVAPATASERERILAAVTRLDPARAVDLTELLMSLPKRERAMCLFNVEVLRTKLVDAKAVLDSEDGAGVPVTNPAPQAVPEPVTPQSKRAIPGSQEGTPRTPDLSSRGASAATSPTPATPGTTHTVASLARLPAVEIIKIASSPSMTGLPLPKADPLVVEATDKFIDSLSDKPIQSQKQLLGDKLFRVIKAFGLKQAPKLTIALLDGDDLRALAHLMNSYPSVLKEKAIFIQASLQK
ncbi:hypothetical protein B0F90DRAFT_1629948 [Multifurca ochricompacta]|uniref:RRM domain-containing protein n=1 Tax=Multifurca ochricompacta TaxID=376703 RepID=A0AAD4M3N1_9AGAM|nr:hypothetical protein B0F90DRAFT_1629948 [Multifurca ochricompacta]